MPTLLPHLKLAIEITRVPQTFVKYKDMLSAIK